MIQAYPPTQDPLILELVAVLNRAAEARFYIALEMPGHSSGFYAQARDLTGAKREARAHLRK